MFINGLYGPQVSCCDQVSVEFIIDGVKVKSEALVVNIPLKGADVFVGQPVLNNGLYRLVIQGSTVTFERSKQEPANEEIVHISSICADAEVSKVRLVCSSDTVIPANTAQFVETDSNEILQDSTVLFVDTRSCRFNDVEYSIPSSLYCAPVNSVFVINQGTNPLAFKKGQLLVRGYVVEETSVSAPRGTDVLVNSIMKVDVSKIKCGIQDPSVLNKLSQILQEFSDCFSEDTRELGVTNKIELNIELNSDKPVCYRPYRLSYSEKTVMREKIEDMLSNGIIRESTSNYASPIILVRKKNGDFRLCVDFRKLNSITVKDKYPLPVIEEHIEKLGEKKYFTSLDLSQGFYQIPVAKDDIHKTGFVTPEGHYEFLRMPFGLANSPAVFQRLMDRIFSTLRHDKVLPYIDDVLLPTNSIEEGLDLLKVVLQIIRDAGLTLNLEKCFFLQTKIDYLGYEICEEGIRPGSKKIDAVLAYKEPTNIHELRMFLGLTSYFRKFVQNYAGIAYDLYRLLQKNVGWEWGPQQQKAFQELKKVLTTRPLLSLFRREGDIEVHTDASSRGLAGILLQKQDGNLKPISYFSRKTSKEESMYHSYELETLAVVESLRRFRIYLVGNHFKVVTDCSAVRYTFQKKDLTPRIVRWWLLIQEYDMEVEHKPGKSHSHVDALSRSPVEPPQVIDINTIDVFDWIVCLQNQDEKIRIIKTKLESGEAEPDIKNNYKLKEERLYRVIAGDCLYKRSQYGRAEGELHPIEKIAEPLHTVHIDHLGPFCKSRADSLNTSVENERDWDMKLSEVTWGMNNLHSSSTGFTPFKLMFSASRSRYQAIAGNSFDDEQTAEQTRCTASGNLKRTAEVMQKHFNAKRKRPTKYKVNDLVLWKGAADRNINVRRKLKEKFSGPYKITKVAESQSRQDGRVSITAIEVSRAANRWRNGCVDGATSLPSTRHTTPFLSWPQEGTRLSQLWRQHSYQTDQSATFVPITPLEPRNVISRGNCNQIIGGEFVIQPFENLDRRGHYAWNFGSENNCKLVVG
ncbi:uncharacterized protein LOC133516650 [Cydia pomonella]|uniref:uncharacterized protein LOC133516650 n=1 Tax=Cydia pomonella TaxID=82600 RepID=UPI002ADDB07E|nr:uncharacterized protein LOC133516650 [Cydia pomonella]